MKRWYSKCRSNKFAANQNGGGGGNVGGKDADSKTFCKF